MATTVEEARGVRLWLRGKMAAIGRGWTAAEGREEQRWPAEEEAAEGEGSGGYCDKEGNDAVGQRRGSGVRRGLRQRRATDSWPVAIAAGRHGRKAALEDKGRWWSGREGSGATRDSDRELISGKEEAAAGGHGEDSDDRREEEDAVGGRGEDSDGRQEKAVVVADEGCGCGYDYRFLEEETRAAVVAAGGRGWEQKAGAAGDRRRDLVPPARKGREMVAKKRRKLRGPTRAMTARE
ncbi:hypothetical protein B296_00049182 [Ensete ventricosum]|uniref:Uncharacterized protein n=1 Tax=Ensete ventricosum TaxID=4639 RepID=A0A426X3C2_ENSVE|nr:hypothetical protein B296_00049182 [Ensete ventricosum]